MVSGTRQLAPVLGARNRRQKMVNVSSTLHNFQSFFNTKKWLESIGAYPEAGLLAVLAIRGTDFSTGVSGMVASQT